MCPVNNLFIQNIDLANSITRQCYYCDYIGIDDTVYNSIIPPAKSDFSTMLHENYLLYYLLYYFHIYWCLYRNLCDLPGLFAEINELSIMNRKFVIHVRFTVNVCNSYMVGKGRF